jgi:anti-sigma factor RsiW
MNECDEIEPLLTPWVDGEASDTDRARVAAHLARCSACATRAHAVQTARVVLQSRRAALVATPPRDWSAQIAAARGTRSRAGVRWAAAAAVMSAILLSGMRVATGRSDTVLAAQLALDHKKCHWLEGDSATLDALAVRDRLAARYGLRTAVPPGSADQRLRLVGARRCLTGEGTDAHLLYRYEGRPVSLFLVPQETRPPRTVDVMGAQAWVWSRHNGTYVLVADASIPDLPQLVAYMQRATR